VSDLPKIKTHRGAAKRFKVTKNGKVKRAKAYRGHLLTHKTSKRKRQLRKSAILTKADQKRIKKVIPYK
jgi:large subunit ribosomal protein L35